MHKILPARLKPGVTRDSIAAPASATSAEDATSTAVIRGKALIFWDLKVLGKKKKLDAIDTDQITPAADCVSESLDTLDERWKAGSFRYLMPDFRARVHRGETFVIAGDRFAIGSSREMSPAGLKAIADEVGLRDGDRLRQQHGRHLPPQRAQPRAARRAEPRGGGRRAATATSSASIRSRARLTNETQGKTYEPVPLTPKEDEIRADRRHLRGRPPRVQGVGRDARRAIEWPDADAGAPHDVDRADRLGASRRQVGARSRPARRCASTPICCRPRTAPRRSRSTPSTRSPAATRSFRGRRRSPTITSSSPARTTTTSRPASAASSRGCTASRSRTTRRPATASSTSIFRSRGW